MSKQTANRVWVLRFEKVGHNTKVLHPERMSNLKECNIVVKQVNVILESSCQIKGGKESFIFENHVHPGVALVCVLQRAKGPDTKVIQKAIALSAFAPRQKIEDTFHARGSLAARQKEGW